jgi:RNA polymerase sigma-70 factor (ECF subfamily)
MQVLHDETEADDVLQEVFLQVWDRAPSYSSGKGKLMSWLCTLARRRAIDRLRQHSAYRRATDRYEVSCNHSDKGIDESHTVEREAFRDDLRSLLDQQLNTLPPNQQEVIRLAFLEEKSQRDFSPHPNASWHGENTNRAGYQKLSHAFGGLREKVE